MGGGCGLSLLTHQRPRGPDFVRALAVFALLPPPLSVYLCDCNPPPTLHHDPSFTLSPSIATTNTPTPHLHFLFIPSLTISLSVPLLYGRWKVVHGQLKELARLDAAAMAKIGGFRAMT